MQIGMFIHQASFVPNNFSERTMKLVSICGLLLLTFQIIVLHFSSGNQLNMIFSGLEDTNLSLSLPPKDTNVLSLVCSEKFPLQVQASAP